MFKRLAGDTGSIIDTPPHDGDSDERLVRAAILVHEGTFQSQDGEIAFDESRIKRVIENHNAMINNLATQYGGLEKMPMGAFPPILDQHADDSSHRVLGRLSSLLRFERRDIPKVGAGVACATADILFLGKDTVEKVKDGRIYHLSIGIDEATDTLGETSTVIEPAAPGAMILSRRKRLYKSEKYKGWLIETLPVLDHYVKVHVTDPKGNLDSMFFDTVEQAKKYIDRQAAKLSDNTESKGGTRMSAKKMLEAQKSARRAKLSAIQESLKGITRTIATSGANVRLEAKKSKVAGQFKRLMASGKMTPAEFKKLSIAKLAALDDTALETVMGAFDSREPVIMPGQRGSTDAVNFGEIGQKLEEKQRKNLKAETAKELARLSGKKFKLAEKDEDDVTDEKKLAEEKEEVKKELAIGDDGVGTADIGGVESPVESSPDANNVLQGQIDELNTQVARIAGMVEELMSSEDEENGEKPNSDESNTADAAREAVVS